METFSDINAYYAWHKKVPKRMVEDFKILRLENIGLEMDKEELQRLKIPHRRDFFELSFAQKEVSSTLIRVGNAKFKGIDNNVIFTSPHQVFSIDFGKKLEEQEVRGFLIAFKPSFLIKEQRDFLIMNKFSFFNSYTCPNYILGEEQLGTVMNLVNRIYTEFVSDELYSLEIIKAYFEALLHLFNRILSINPIIAPTSSFNQIATRFEQKIIDSGSAIASIKEYANALNISPNYLSECVKKATGKSAKQILLSHKLIIAKSLLQEQDKNIAEIAYEMGYTEPTNFTKFFKQMTGTTPNQFRASF